MLFARRAKDPLLREALLRTAVSYYEMLLSEPMPGWIKYDMDREDLLPSIQLAATAGLEEFEETRYVVRGWRLLKPGTDLEVIEQCTLGR